MQALITSESAFDRPVLSCTRNAATAHPETPMSILARTLQDVPTVAIVDELENLVGVVSRTDIVALRANVRHRTANPRSSASGIAADVMTRGVVTVPSTATIRAAAQAMAAHAIHHVYVTDGRLLLGVVNALDIAITVRDARISTQLSAIMTSPPIMVGAQTQLGAAVDLLSRARVSGLVVVDEGRPIGTFTHLDALAARDLPRTTLIEELYEPAVLCLPCTTPLYSVASQLARMNTHRVIACSEREVVGIATTLDFVRYVAW